MVLELQERLPKYSLIPAMDTAFSHYPAAYKHYCAYLCRHYSAFMTETSIRHFGTCPRFNSRPTLPWNRPLANYCGISGRLED